MKKLFTILVAVLFTATAFLPQQASAGAPDKMSYQAVIRNTSDQLIKNGPVGMRISIERRESPKVYRDVYVETQKPTTNENGLISITIGEGTKESGVDFSTIDWGNERYYIFTECDPKGGTTYTIKQRSELLSVPYALYAKTASSLTHKSLSLNVYGAYLHENKAKFGRGNGVNSGIVFNEAEPTSAFVMNFTIPQDYITGDAIQIRMLVSATETGKITLETNALSVVRKDMAGITGTSTATGLSVNPIDIKSKNVVQEIFGFITSPKTAIPLEAGDAISFGFFRRSSDPNPGNFFIQGIEIRY